MFTRPVFEVRQAKQDGGDNIDMAYKSLPQFLSENACHPHIYLVATLKWRIIKMFRRNCFSSSIKAEDMDVRGAALKQ